MKTRIYLDHAATTCPSPTVLEAMHRCALDGYGNPSSIHQDGLQAARRVEQARLAVATRLHADPGEIVFTSGGTEANNLALKGVVGVVGGRHVVTSVVEHPSILEVCGWLERLGHAVTRVPVDGEGRVDPADVRRALRPETVLVSVMQGNNEIGTLQPLAEIGAICREAGVLFHTDACQTFTRVPLDVTALKVDLASVNAHKIHGPKGVGALFVRSGVTLEPLFHGGGQEAGRRSGTLNTPGIVGFGQAVAETQEEEVARMTRLRDLFIDGVLERIQGARLTGSRRDRLCTLASFVFEGVSGKKLQRAMGQRGVTVSAGSACHSGDLAPSHVLVALGVPPEVAHSALRVSLGLATREEEIGPALAALEESVRELRATLPMEARR